MVKNIESKIVTGMDTEEIINLARDVVTAWDWTSDVSRPWPTRLDVRIRSMAELVPVVVGLRVKRLGNLAAIVGLDLGADGLEVLYHFCKGELVITLRVRLPRKEACLPTLSEIIPNAGAFERELSETFGIEIRGLSASTPACLPADWPAGVFPLRKDVSLQSLPATVKPATTFHFVVQGGVVTGAQLQVEDNGWRFEKMAETVASATDPSVFAAPSASCPQAQALAFSLAVEQLHGVEAPPRARFIRVLAAELERLQHHLSWLAETATTAGFISLFAEARRDQETARAMLKNMGTQPVSLPGGVRFNLLASGVDCLRKGSAALEASVRLSLEVAAKDALFQRHARGMGVMTRAQAEVLGVVGPTARACSVSRDVRVEAPDCLYQELPAAMLLETGGDLEARFKLHLREALESLRLIKQVLDSLPEGELCHSLPEAVPAGEAVVRVEAPEGELLTFIRSNGGESFDRFMVRAPGQCNLASALRLTIGHRLAEVPVLLAGFDSGCAGHARLVHVRDLSAGRERTMGWDELR